MPPSVEELNATSAEVGEMVHPSCHIFEQSEEMIGISRGKHSVEIPFLKPKGFRWNDVKNVFRWSEMLNKFYFRKRHATFLSRARK